MTENGTKLPLQRRSFMIGAAATGASMAMPSLVRAASWPERPLTMIVPSDAGGSIDRAIRGLSTVMQKHIGQPIQVENRPGGSFMLGVRYFLQQPQDGNVILAHALSPYIASSILFHQAPYKIEDFAFMNAFWSDWDVIAAYKDSPYRTLPDLLKAIKENPKKVRASVVTGSSGHLTTLLMLQRAGIPVGNLNLVTFQGGGQARQAIAGGQVDFIVIAGSGSEGVREFVKPLAVVRDTPHPDWDAPVLAEAIKSMGLSLPVLPGSMRGLAMSARFRAEHPDRWDIIQAAHKATLQDPDFIKFAESNAMGHDWLGPEKTTEKVKAVHDIFAEFKPLLQR